MTEDYAADFGELVHTLNALNASWEPAEAHGAFCGRACLVGVAALHGWVHDLAGEVNTENVLAQEHVSRLQSFAADTLLKLEAGQMQFQLLLPDEDDTLHSRTAGLADWCHGFMHGLASAGAADEGPCADALDSSVSKEILDDFSEITRAASESGGEADEQAFEELVEYVRVSAQLVYEEMAPLREKAANRTRH